MIIPGSLERDLDRSTDYRIERPYIARFKLRRNGFIQSLNGACATNS